MNPFFTKFDTKYDAVPFSKIKNEHFIPALKKSIELAKNRLLEITKNVNPATFDNTILKLENCDEEIGIVSGVFFNLLSAQTNEELQEMAKEFSPLLTDYSNSIALDPVLFAKVKTVFDNRDQLGLKDDELVLLEKKYKFFSRNGANLKDEDKESLKTIDKELSILTLEFSDNVLKETNNYELVVSNIDELDGLSKDDIKQAAICASEKGMEGKWVFTLDYPSLIPLITYAKNRSLREKITTASSLKANQNNEFDNKEIVKKITRLKYKRARLLGYDNHATFVLEEKMAKDFSTVNTLLEKIVGYALPLAKNEILELSQFAKDEDGIDEFKSWDYFYYTEKLKKKLFNIDDEMLRPYFKLENVLNGVFTIAKKLYGISFIEIDTIDKYHEDVKTYEVKNEDDSHLAIFYADFFPRPEKRNGAWMTEYRAQHNDGKDVRPHVSIVCNFTKPIGDKPSLLTFNEVTTLFHEFGHALHGMLSQVRFESLSGTSVLWDFVELPSQIMENWAFEKEALDIFAKHYKTNETIPENYIQKIKESANFHEARNSIRQVSFSLLDMAWHNCDPTTIEDVIAFENNAMKRFELFPRTKGASMSTSFSHIFAGGYSAGYYSYKWAEVLDADAFEVFKEKGIFCKETATSFRKNILEKGGSKHPMDLYINFRGQGPTPEALLKRSGLI